MKTNDLQDAADFFDYDPATGVIVDKVTRQEKGYRNDRGYVVFMFRKKIYKAHRVAWTIFYGQPPNGEIDHINHQKHDNRIENLRDVPSIDNARNLGISSQNKSGVVGVSFHKKENKWRARIKVDQKEQHLGYFSTMKEAIQARQFAEELHGFHFNHGK